jgi:hypothetical protein
VCTEARTRHFLFLFYTQNAAIDYQLLVTWVDSWTGMTGPRGD